MILASVMKTFLLLKADDPLVPEMSLCYDNNHKIH